MGETTLDAASAPRKTGLLAVAGLMLFFLGAGLASLGLLVHLEDSPVALTGFPSFALGFFLSRLALHRGAHPRSLCVAGAVLCCLGLFGYVAYLVFKIWTMPIC